MKTILKDSQRSSFFLIILLLTVVCNSCKNDDEIMRPSEVTADFSADLTNALTSQPIVFSDLSEGDVTHWSWLFEGGVPNKSHEQNPIVYYSNPGYYNVKLVASNSRYTDVIVKEEYISVTLTPQPVTAKFIADKVSILSGETVTFTDESEGGPTAWEWEFIPESGTPFTSSERNPEITFENEGAYTVKLMASNSKYTDEIVKENYITVIDADAVAADFTADITQTFTGQEITFTDQSVGTVTSWEWSFEGGTPAVSTEQNPIVTYETAGKFKVTLIASNSSNTSTMEKAGYITVVPGHGLVTFLPFSGNSNDIGPLNLTVENLNEAVRFDGKDRANNSNAAAVFDGNSYLRIQPHADKQLVSSYSVGIWMKTDNPSAAWLWMEGRQDDVAAWFKINQNSSTQIYSFLPQLGGIFHMNSENGSILSDDVWHHIVCVRDAGSGSAKIYIDGEQVAERSITASNLTNDYGFFVGAQNLSNNLTNFFNGQLDDVIIYNRALTDDEIRLLSGL